MSNQTATLVACALGLLCALGCFALHATTNRKLVSLDSQIDTFNRTKRALTADKKSLKDLEKQLGEKRETLNEIRIANSGLSVNLSQAKRMRKFQQDTLAETGRCALARAKRRWLLGAGARKSRQRRHGSGDRCIEPGNLSVRNEFGKVRKSARLESPSGSDRTE